MSEHSHEQVARFGPGGILAGVLTSPPAREDSADRGILLVNAGLLHRVGPNRLYVSLARDLAALGLPVLRFDFAGLGDSGRHGDNLPLDQTVLRDIDSALTFATAQTGARTWLLIGHCSGAIIASYLAQSDPRIAGVLAINFAPVLDPDWVAVDRDEKNARYFLRYYIKSAIRNPGNWKRLLAGQVRYRRIFGALASGVIRALTRTTVVRVRSQLSAKAARSETSVKAGDRKLDLDAIVAQGAQVQFVFSEGNAGLDYLRTSTAGRLDALVQAGSIALEIVPRSDHLFSTAESQHRLREIARTFANTQQRSRELICAMA